MLGKITLFLEQTKMGLCTLTYEFSEFSFTLENDSGRLLICRVQRTVYKQSKMDERHSYSADKVIFWAGTSLDEHTELHVFHGGTFSGVRYQNEILYQYISPYTAAFVNDFILLGDNIKPHQI